jgi:hypothetical protein
LASGDIVSPPGYLTFEEVVARYGWTKNNILVAVAGSEHDGTSGTRSEAEGAQPQEVERFSHIIFAASARGMVGRGAKRRDPDVIRASYGVLKPCLHSSDVGTVIELLTPTECANFFKAAGYDPA